MLLRSSSTPVLGSLIPPLPVSDNHKDKEGKANFSSENMNQLYFHNANSHITTYSSLDSCSIEEDKDAIPSSNFRRVQSESDLRSLSRVSPAPAKVGPETLFEGNSFDDFQQTSFNKPWSRRVSAHKRLPSLKSIPSFACYYDEEAVDERLEHDNDSGMVESQLQDFSFENEAMGEIVGRVKDLYTPERVEEMVSAAPLFMARGLGLDVIDPQTDIGGSGGNSSWKGVSTGGSGGDGFGAGSDNIEEHYQRMLEGNPGNSLLLRNYAQFLHESKHFHKAEEYYSRAILAQPDDGELLAQYAKLIWELHHDEERASTYFEQAVQASPEDCHVAAAYASFLWDTDTEEQEQDFSSVYNGTDVLGTLGYSATTVS